MDPLKTNAIAEVVKMIEDYVNALQNKDVEALKSIFHPAANFFFYREGKLNGVGIDFLFNMVANQQGEVKQIKYCITSTTMSGKIASAALDIPDLMGVHIIDMFTLTKDGEKWLIASKVSYRPDEV
jgi:hypothetical protein